MISISLSNLPGRLRAGSIAFGLFVYFVPYRNLRSLIKAKILNMEYSCTPSYERERIGGKKKVNAIKDGLLILSEIVKYLFKGKK